MALALLWMLEQSLKERRRSRDVFRRRRLHLVQGQASRELHGNGFDSAAALGSGGGRNGAQRSCDVQI